MPGSAPDFDDTIAEFIVSLWPASRVVLPIKVLDIGAGAGKYGALFYPYWGIQIDAIEVYTPYITEYELETKYDKVYCTDICDFPVRWYDVIILGAVLEHLPVIVAQDILRLWSKSCRYIIVTVPFLCKQGAVNDNPYERHIQDDLTPDVMKTRYPLLSEWQLNDKRGLYRYENKM